MDHLKKEIGVTGPLQIDGDAQLASCFGVTDFLADAMGLAGLAIAEASQALGQRNDLADVRVDRRLASLWAGYSIAPQGWNMPPAWDDIAGDYQASDGWIRLHTNAANHRAATLRVLGCAAAPEAVRQEVANWRATDLETAVVAEGGVAAEMRSRTAWHEHPQGALLTESPLVQRDIPRALRLRDFGGRADRPLAGLRVLDLTRILAGPVATRFLAGFGADVLRLDPPDWEEASLAPEVTLGKRCARLDLRAPAGQARFAALLSQADVLVHGYRADALDVLGLGDHWRRSVAPDLIEVTLNAYGWQGPWRDRRGFDSLVQMSSGIAAAGQEWAGTDRPTPLPVQALDFATGYLMAATVATALRDAALGTPVATARLSLAATAEALMRRSPAREATEIGKAVAQDYAAEVETTVWGKAKRLRPALRLMGAPMHYDRGARPLGQDQAIWPAPV